MASVQKRNRNGRISYLIQFINNGVRKSVSLSSDYSFAYVKTLANIIDQLVVSNETDVSPPKQVAIWIKNAPLKVKQKLEKVGLVRFKVDYAFNELFELYMNSVKNGVSSETIRSRNTYFKITIKYFKPTVRLSQFDKRFVHVVCDRIYNDKTKSEATKAGIIKFLKAITNWAVKSEIIEKSPFSDVKATSSKNKEREYFVSIEEYNKFIEAIQDPEIKLALALYRIGGLRRSEVLGLNWDDIEEDRVKVYASKTGKTRFVPLFQEIRKQLDDLPNKSGRLFVRHTSANSIRHALEKARNVSGVTKYPRMIQNLRSSRSNEVFREYGPIAEQSWIGHSTSVAFDHYLHAMDYEFKRACNDPVGCKKVCTKHENLCKKDVQTQQVRKQEN